MLACCHGRHVEGGATTRRHRTIANFRVAGGFSRYTRSLRMSKDPIVVRRRGKIFVTNSANPRLKARQGKNAAHADTALAVAHSGPGTDPARAPTGVLDVRPGAALARVERADRVTSSWQPATYR
jgi:ribosomal protein L36